MQWITEETGWMLPDYALIPDPNTPEARFKRGNAAAQISCRCLVGFSGSGSASAGALSLCAGIAAAGGSCTLMPCSVPPELGAASLAGHFDLLLWCSDTALYAYSRGLLPVTQARRDILCGTPEEISLQPGEYGTIADGSSLRAAYPARMHTHLPAHTDLRIIPQNAAPRIQALFAHMAGGKNPLTVHFSADCRAASVYTPETGWIFYEKLLLMVAREYLRHGEQTALPFWVSLPNGENGQVLHYDYQPDGSDTEARALAAEQGYTLDAGILLADFLRFHAETQPDLRRWAQSVPEQFTVRRLLTVRNEQALRCAADPRFRRTPNGLRGEDARGEILLFPVQHGKALGMMIAAHSMEAAAELAAELSP